jgi:hypothetical protein
MNANARVRDEQDWLTVAVEVALVAGVGKDQTVSEAKVRPEPLPYQKINAVLAPAVAASMLARPPTGRRAARPKM